MEKQETGVVEEGKLPFSRKYAIDSTGYKVKLAPSRKSGTIENGYGKLMVSEPGKDGKIVLEVNDERQGKAYGLMVSTEDAQTVAKWILEAAEKKETD